MMSRHAHFVNDILDTTIIANSEISDENKRVRKKKAYLKRSALHYKNLLGKTSGNVPNACDLKDAITCVWDTTRRGLYKGGTLTTENKIKVLKKKQWYLYVHVITKS